MRSLARTADPASLANRQRSARFALFEAAVALIPRPLRIIDVGGTAEFWERRGWVDLDGVEVTLVNHEPEPQRFANILPVAGDARNLSEWGNRSFDVAFSNSTIEHLFTWEAQAAMARETQRVAVHYWVQTPNYWFPIEPHFLTPGWQFLPRRTRVAVIRRYQCGWRGPCPDLAAARAAVDEIRLLRGNELAELFPGGTLLPERFGGLVKSWTVHSFGAMSSS